MSIEGPFRVALPGVLALSSVVWMLRALVTLSATAATHCI